MPREAKHFFWRPGLSLCDCATTKTVLVPRHVPRRRPAITEQKKHLRILRNKRPHTHTHTHTHAHTKDSTSTTRQSHKTRAGSDLATRAGSHCWLARFEVSTSSLKRRPAIPPSSRLVTRSGHLNDNNDADRYIHTYIHGFKIYMRMRRIGAPCDEHAVGAVDGRPF